LGDDGTASTRVIVAARVRLYREGLAALLAREEGVEVLGTSGDSEELVALAAALEPDVVLLDPALPGGREVIRELALERDVPVVAVGCAGGDDEVIACAEAGATGVLSADASDAEVLAAITGAADGEALCSPQMAGVLLRRVAALASGAPSPSSPLTTRELQVVKLIDEGLSNKQIAEELEIGLSTVKHHVHHILEKLDVARRSEAVARLRQIGVLQG
jgi:two-component system, NarL family, nitrate/nitrite response regulator NarL